MWTWWRAASACAVLTTLSHAPFAKAEERGVELRLGALAARGLLDTTSSLPHTPDFAYGLVSGTVTQTLPLRGGWDAGLGAQLDVPLGESGFGLQLLVDHAWTDVAGDLGSLRVRMQYETAFPPDYARRIVDVDTESEWPGATGRARTLALAANFAWTRRERGGWRWGVSGGVALLRTSATVQSLGHGRYWLGGHGVLFGDVAELEFETAPTSGLGFDGGAFVDVKVGSRLSLRLDGRWYAAGERSADVTLTRVLNVDDLFSEPRDLQSISAVFEPAPVAVAASFFRASLSLGYRF